MFQFICHLPTKFKSSANIESTAEVYSPTMWRPRVTSQFEKRPFTKEAKHNNNNNNNNNNKAPSLLHPTGHNSTQCIQELHTAPVLDEKIHLTREINFTQLFVRSEPLPTACVRADGYEKRSLKTTCQCELYLKHQSVPRSKHTPSQLYKPVS